MASASPAFKLSVYALDDATANVAGLSRWQALRTVAEQNTPFSSLPFARALAEHSGRTAKLWITADDTGDVAGLITFHRKQGPFKRAEVPPFTPFTPVLLAKPEVAQEPLNFLVSRLASSFDDIRLHLHPPFQDTRSFTWAGWQSAPFYTYQLHLPTYNADRKQWSKGTQRNYKKNKDLFKITECTSDLDQIVTLCADGYKRNGRTFPITPDQLRSVARDLMQANMIRCFSAVDTATDNIAAGVVVLHDDVSAYYWIAGSIPGPAMTVLLGNMLPALQSAGFETFDFVGANTPGIAEFKRRFGAILTPYYAVTHTPNRLLATLLRVKRLVGA